MITVRREWMAKGDKHFEAIDDAKAYREKFGLSSSWRIYTLDTGKVFQIIIEEDYESLAEHQEKWAERVQKPEWENWVQEWQRVTDPTTFVINYLNLH
jgi:hypothetical protein